MNPVVVPIVRRALLDLLFDVGGEQNDEVLATLLARLGHRIARREVADALRWLAGQDLVKVEELGPYLVARICADGRDVAEGRLVLDGIHRFKTGE